MFNEREDAAELKNLPIGKALCLIFLDDNMHGIIEEEEMEDEGSDEEVEADAADDRWRVGQRNNVRGMSRIAANL